MNGWKLNSALALLLLILIATIAGVFDKDEQQVALPMLIPAYTAASIDSIDVQQGERHCHLHREKNGIDWRLTEPFDSLASRLALQKLLQMPSRRDYQALDIEPAQLAQFGLAPAQLQVHIAGHRLSWGITHSLDGRRYVSVDDRVLLIKEDVFPLLQDCPKNLMSRALLEPGQQLRGLQLPTLSLKHKDGVWHFDPPPPKQWSQDDVQRFVDEWRSAQALTVEQVTQRFATTPPLYKIQLQLDHGDLHFDAYRIGAQIWWVNRERGLRYYLFENSAQKLLQPYAQANAMMKAPIDQDR